MATNREFCPFENDFFSSSEFKIVAGTRVHDVDPMHRATDGIPVEERDGIVVPLEAPDATLEQVFRS